MTRGSRKRPWWQWVLGAFVALLLLGALFGEDEEHASDSGGATTATAPPAVPTEEAAASEPPPPPLSTGCDPNYTGCVPPYPPDVDCSDVGESVLVLGSDPHGLDRDDDGVGCE